jgi:hypothetical protein
MNIVVKIHEINHHLIRKVLSKFDVTPKTTPAKFIN